MRQQLGKWAVTLLIPMCAPLACGGSSEPKTPDTVAEKRQPQKKPTAKTPKKAKLTQSTSDEANKMTPASRLLDEWDQAEKKSGKSPLDDQNWGTVPWGNGAWGDGSAQSDPTKPDPNKPDPNRPDPNKPNASKSGAEAPSPPPPAPEPIAPPEPAPAEEDEAPYKER